MKINRIALTGLTAIIVATAVISGPLIHGVDFTPQSEGLSPGSGTAEITVKSVPDTATITRSTSRNGEYVLQIPDSTVVVQNVSGTPLLVYKIQIRELGHTRGTTVFLNSSMTGRQALTLDSSYFDESEISKSEYEGTITILLRSDAGEQQLHHGNVSIEVQE